MIETKFKRRRLFRNLMIKIFCNRIKPTVTAVEANAKTVANNKQTLQQKQLANCFDCGIRDPITKTETVQICVCG